MLTDGVGLLEWGRADLNPSSVLGRFGSASSESGDKMVSAFERLPCLMWEVARDIGGFVVLWVVTCAGCAGWLRRCR